MEATLQLMIAKEIIATLGLLLIVLGVGWIYRPAALILAGILLFLYAYMTAKPQVGTSAKRSSSSK
jgi:hypothetical protein